MLRYLARRKRRNLNQYGVRSTYTHIGKRVKKQIRPIQNKKINDGGEQADEKADTSAEQECLGA
jgi:hypothetical protein